MQIVPLVILGCFALGMMLIGFNLAGPNANATGNLEITLVILYNKLMGAIYIVGSMIVFALLLR